ncbi:uncharacterized protein [Neodiprion pinetum]|uniref:uncharacterized protein n=1 Tax=Neodiprion pinetum TaxID=441929 RepID=UPI003714FFF1
MDGGIAGGAPLTTAPAKNKRVQAAIVSEPSRSQGGGRWFDSSDRKAGVLVLDNTLPAKLVIRGTGYTTTRIGNVVVTSCYFSPNKTDEEFQEYLDGLVEAVLNKPKEKGVIGIIVAEDLNAWSTVWESARTDTRGQAVEVMAAQADLMVCNQGQRPTFARGTATSTVDITLASSSLTAAVAGTWEVSQDESLTDHKYVMYETSNRDSGAKPGRVAQPRGGEEVEPTTSITRGWVISKMDPNKFRAKLQEEILNRLPQWAQETSDGAEVEARELRERIERACDVAALR